MSKDDKKSITPAYEYKVDGYRYQLMREIAIANKSAVDNLVGALTSLTISETNMFSLITMLEDEVRKNEVEIADLTSENLHLGDEVGNCNSDVGKLNDSLDFKDKWIKALKEENKSLVLLRNQLSTQLFSANVEIEALKQKIADLEAEKSGKNKEDKE